MHDVWCMATCLVVHCEPLHINSVLLVVLDFCNTTSTRACVRSHDLLTAVPAISLDVMCHKKWAKVTLQPVTHMLTGAMDVSSPNQMKFTKKLSEFRMAELQLCIVEAMSFFTSNYVFPPLALQDLDRFFSKWKLVFQTVMNIDDGTLPIASESARLLCSQKMFALLESGRAIQLHPAVAPGDHVVPPALQQQSCHLTVTLSRAASEQPVATRAASVGPGSPVTGRFPLDKSSCKFICVECPLQYHLSCLHVCCALRLAYYNGTSTYSIQGKGGCRGFRLL